ncbi:MAG: Flp family type IVb pilin [Bryobacteraceae bacterium]|jgi:Flp pilus assembly pilin Flp
MRRVVAFWLEEDGQDLIEYSLLIVFIAMACLALLGGGHNAVNGIWQVNTNHLNSAAQVAAGEG